MVPYVRDQSGCSTYIVVERCNLSKSHNPGDARLHWMPIAVDSTSRHEASYVHCTLGGTRSPVQLARWSPQGPHEEWATLYAATQEVDFDQRLWDASKVAFHDTSRETLFFLLCRGQGTNFNGQLRDFES